MAIFHKRAARIGYAFQRRLGYRLSLSASEGLHLVGGTLTFAVFSAWLLISLLR